MQEELGRIQNDIQVIKQAIGLDGDAPPDSPVPHLLMAASGAVCLAAGWALEVTGGFAHPLLAGLAMGSPPLIAMIIWGRLKARDPAFHQPSPVRAKLRREFWWQTAGSALLIGVLLGCGLEIISAPVIVSMITVLAIGLLNRPMVERREYSGIGWCVGLAFLTTWMLMKWPEPLSRGSILGLTLVIGGALAAAIAALSRKRSLS